MAYNETPTDWTAMFKNREFRIKMVKNPENNKTATSATEERSSIDTEQLTKAAVLVAQRVAVTVVAAIVAVKVVDTLSQIAVKKTKSADNE